VAMAARMGAAEAVARRAAPSADVMETLRGEGSGVGLGTVVSFHRSPWT